MFQSQLLLLLGLSVVCLLADKTEVKINLPKGSATAYLNADKASKLSRSRVQNTVSEVEAALYSSLDTALKGQQIIQQSYVKDYASYLETYNKLDSYPIDGSDNYQELLTRYEQYLLSWDIIDTYETKYKDENRKFGHTIFSDWTKDEKLRLLTNKDQMKLINTKLQQKNEYTSFSGWSDGSNSLYTDFSPLCQSVKDEGINNDFGKNIGNKQFTKKLDLNFAMTGQFECNNHLYNSQDMSFSEQYNLDCNSQWISDNGYCSTTDYWSFDGVDSWNCEDCWGTKTYSSGIATIADDSFDTAVDVASYVSMSFWMAVDESFFYLDSDHYHYYSCDKDNIIGYHAMTVVGQQSFSDNNWLYVKNSWGNNWGYYGYFWLQDNSAHSCQVRNFVFDYWYSSSDSSNNNNNNADTLSMNKNGITIPKPNIKTDVYDEYFYYFVGAAIIATIALMITTYCVTCKPAKPETFGYEQIV